MKRTVHLLLCCLLGAHALADTKLRLAFNELEPWKTRNAAGQPDGAYYHLMVALAAKLGLQLELIDCPLKRCLILLEQGQADIAIGLQRSAEREAYLLFLNTPYRQRSSDKVFYMRLGEASRLRQYEDLRQLNIGVKLGSETFDRLDRDNTLQKDAAPSQEINLRKLVAGRIDVLPIAEDQGEYLISKLGLRSTLDKASYREPDGSPRSIALSRRSPWAARWQEFDRAMAELVRDGSLLHIYRAHYYEKLKIPASVVEIR